MSVDLIPAGQRVVVGIVSDTHAGHSLGLANPQTKLYDPIFGELYHPALNLPQRRLWEWYEQDVAGVLAVAGSDPLIVAHLGDPTQGNRWAGELMDARMSSQIEIAAANMEPWRGAKNLRAIRMVAGTGVHEFGEGSSARMTARILKEQAPELDVDSSYHPMLKAGGAELDLAHHGPHPGSRAWLKGNILRLYTLSIMQAALENGENPPAFVGRGHYHSYTYEVVTKRARGQTFQTHGMILPCYCFPGEHARKAAQSPSHVTLGMVALEIVGGRIQRCIEFMRTVDFRTREVIQ